MKREDVQAKHAEGVVFDTHAIANPSNLHEWIVFFKKGEGRSFFLIDASEEVESFAPLDDLIHELKQLGIKRVEVHC